VLGKGLANGVDETRDLEITAAKQDEMQITRRDFLAN
jgi:hypothetical protein